MNLYKYRKRTLMPLDAFRERFRAALAEEGYESREDVVALVQEIKREQVDDGEESIDCFHERKAD